MDDDWRLLSSSSICRICHEQDMPLEAPCACSGTLKFAHRDCVQRWCNEKGNTVCEICLQKFEPGYTSPPPPQRHPIHTTITIRESLIMAINEQEEENQSTGETSVTVVVAVAVACFRSVVLICTALLLIRHLFAAITGEEGDYPFSVVTVIVVKASGIIVPMYILIQLISPLHKLRLQCDYEEISEDEVISSDEDEDEEQYRIDIQN